MSHIYESCVIGTNIRRVWEAISSFDFKFLDVITKIECKDAELGSVGSVCTATYTNGNWEKYQIVKHDKEKYEIVYTVLESKAELPSEHVSHTIRLQPVTHLNHTYMEFIIDYSKDIPLKLYIDTKFEKRNFFGALKRYLVSDGWSCSYCTFLNTHPVICSACQKDRKIPDNRFFKSNITIEYSAYAREYRFVTRPFSLAGHTWELIVFPKGNDNCNHLSIYLKIKDLVDETCPNFFCNFTFQMIHPDEAQRKNKPLESFHTFSWIESEQDRGFKEVLPLQKITWFLDQNQELTLEVAIAPLPTSPPPTVMD